MEPEIELTPAPEATPDPEPTSGPEADINPPAPPVSDPAPPSDDTFVCIPEYIPDIVVDLRYATENNFTGQVIYTFQQPWLRYGTVLRLAQAQTQLRELGYRICIWDAFRPASAQWKLWEVCPDGNFVANPANGYSGHTRGDTVDISLVDLDGQAVEMPSDFDDFSTAADRNYDDVSATAAANARLLEEVMTRCGFTGYSMEWWHYSDNIRYEPATDFEPSY